MDGCVQLWYSILILQTVKLHNEIREASIVADLGCIVSVELQRYFGPIDRVSGRDKLHGNAVCLLYLYVMLCASNK